MTPACHTLSVRLAALFTAVALLGACAGRRQPAAARAVSPRRQCDRPGGGAGLLCRDGHSAAPGPHLHGEQHEDGYSPPTRAITPAAANLLTMSTTAVTEPSLHL